MIKFKRVRWEGRVARMRENRGAYRNSVGKPDGRGLMGRPKRRWEHNIKLEVQDVG